MITIAFSSHRVETIPFARQMMKEHQIIVLEERPHELLDFVKAYVRTK